MEEKQEKHLHIMPSLLNRDAFSSIQLTTKGRSELRWNSPRGIRKEKNDREQTMKRVDAHLYADGTRDVYQRLL